MVSSASLGGMRVLPKRNPSMVVHSAQPRRAMLQAHQAYSLALLARNDELVTKVMALRPGGALTVIGLGAAQLCELLSQTSSAPRMLRLDFTGITTTALAIDRILDDLADVAAALWPDWNSAAPALTP